jgi:hypothetical protein
MTKRSSHREPAPPLLFVPAERTTHGQRMIGYQAAPWPSPAAIAAAEEIEEFHHRRRGGRARA